MMMIYLYTNLPRGLSDFDYTSLLRQSLQIAPPRETFTEDGRNTVYLW